MLLQQPRRLLLLLQQQQHGKLLGVEAVVSPRRSCRANGRCQRMLLQQPRRLLQQQPHRMPIVGVIGCCCNNRVGCFSSSRTKR